MTQIINRAQSGHAYQVGADLAVINCGRCAIQFAIPHDYHERLVRTHEWFYCPRGCRIHYNGMTEAQRLEAQLERVRDERARLSSQLEQTKSELRTTKGVATRYRNQRNVAREQQVAGECPCCGKEFKVLARHMERMHPDFPEEQEQREVD